LATNILSGLRRACWSTRRLVESFALANQLTNQFP